MAWLTVQLLWRSHAPATCKSHAHALRCVVLIRTSKQPRIPSSTFRSDNRILTCCWRPASAHTQQPGSNTLNLDQPFSVLLSALTRGEPYSARANPTVSSGNSMFYVNNASKILIVSDLYNSMTDRYCTDRVICSSRRCLSWCMNCLIPERTCFPAGLAYALTINRLMQIYQNCSDTRSALSNQWQCSSSRTGYCGKSFATKPCTNVNTRTASILRAEQWILV